MVAITKCLNEWNAIIEALGQGKQTILIRNYNNNVHDFLLYPTISYAKKWEKLNYFKKEYHDFVEKNLLPNSKGRLYEIKYFAKVVKVLKKTPECITDLNEFHIWDKDHVDDFVRVNNFIREKSPYVWILRVYKINNPEFLSRTKGISYANVEKEVNIENLTPVLSDKEFNKILNELIRL